MKRILFFATVAVALLTAFAPGKDKKKSPGYEGKISYSMTYEDLPAELENYASMLPKEMTMYIKGEQSRTEQASGMGTTITIVDKKKKEICILMDMMGAKTAYKGSTDEMKDTTVKAKPEIKVTEETREIAGKKCSKVEITYPGEDAEVVWVTKDMPSGLTRGFESLDGFPMEYTIKRSGMTILLTVTAVAEQKVSAEYFKVPDGYTVKPMSEMKNMMGGGK
ncbi:MAG TPA: DUF4412 domain-containing protein [Flavobacteriales bacterium]|nr:DUF4412 domain-containing protein [Flavobacteriales bacterium]HRE96434.1 DUF4412 domain-containing protein [Flavobacteriales bacterium]HRJ35452.1 DUF4412 domain-containing protein [Flavobacteriales bacterium]HRJ40023.1 DUF4412 domain-containing protein [Flavobacteriales bacterium]